MPSIVTRPVITSSAKAIRLNWRQVVDDREGRRQWKSATMAIGGFSVDVEWRSWWTLTLTLRQKPFQVRGFWRRYWKSLSPFYYARFSTRLPVWVVFMPLNPPPASRNWQRYW